METDKNNFRAASFALQKTIYGKKIFSEGRQQKMQTSLKSFGKHCKFLDGAILYNS